jgi:signal transduction histidine kinase
MSPDAIKPYRHISVSNSQARLEQRLTLALRASNVGVWEYDVIAGSLVWDDQMYRLYGITEDSFGGAYEAWERGLHPEDLEAGRRELLDALAGKKKFDTEFRVLWPSGEVRYIRALADVFYNDGGEPSHMFGVNWDITEQKLMQAALTETNNDLEHFSHIAAHDLREPCRRILAMSRLISEDYSEVLPPEMKVMMDSMGQQAAQMSGMIDSFRAMTNLGANSISLEAFRMEDAIATVLVEYSKELKHAEVSVKVSKAVTGYRNLVQILLRNIISNATKYGAPDMSLSFYTERNDGKTTFVVENSTDHDVTTKRDLFQPFVRDTHKHDGQGIGLSICKRVIDMHGGQIWVDSVDGRFTLKFHLGAAHGG